MMHFALLLVVFFGSAQFAQCVVVQTTYGLVEGVTVDGVNIFKGIPYAKPPVGNLRFQASEPPDPHEGTLSATDWGAACHQAPLFGPLLFAQAANMSEDCLFVNVWAPAGPPTPIPGPRRTDYNANGRAVIVFVSGGGSHVLDGAAFGDAPALVALRQDVILVTFNYRLGPLGFLSVEGARNAGLHDMRRAFDWVASEAAAFGGDAARVTAFGEGDGAAAVAALQLAGAAPFERCIRVSGGWTQPIAARPWTRASSGQLAALVGCPDPQANVSAALDCLRLVDAQTLTDIGTFDVITDQVIFPFPFGIDNLDTTLFTADWPTLAAASPAKSCIVAYHQRESILFVSPPAEFGNNYFTAGENMSFTAFQLVEGLMLSSLGLQNAEELSSLLTLYYSLYRFNPRISSNNIYSYILLADDVVYFAPMHAEMFDKTVGAVSKRPAAKQYVMLETYARDAQWPASAPFKEATQTNLLRDFFDVQFLHAYEQTPEDLEIVDNVQHYFTNFAKTGDPNVPRRAASAGGPVRPWRPTTVGSRAYLQLGGGRQTIMRSFFKAASRELWHKLVADVAALDESRLRRTLPTYAARTAAYARRFKNP